MKNFLRITAPGSIRATLALCGLILLASCGAPPPATSEGTETARLGTRWAEGVESRVSTRDLKREGDLPLSVDLLYYSAAEGAGDPIREMSLAKGSVGLRVLRRNGVPWPIHRALNTVRLTGRVGERYILEYRNYSATRTREIVATVDGLDVLNGQPGELRYRGYVLKPGAVLRIEGFRKNDREVAAFRFARPGDSYAANSDAGSPSNLGVIGTAVFSLAAPHPAPLPECDDGPCAFPGDGVQN